MSGITKAFPGVVANSEVDFEVAVGEVHALLGENGAGKSTLSNVLTGLYRPDAGRIELGGRPVVFASPRDAIDAGIGMVHQHFRLVPTFTVAENVELGRPGPLNPARAEQRVRELGERFGLPVDPRRPVWQLSVGEQQRVEILKALDREARLLILDEPTAVLTPQEAEALAVTLRSMVAEGASVVFISHKLEEVRRVADRVTVLRDGRSVGTVEAAGTDTRSLARMMVGREVVFAADEDAGSPPAPRDRVVLSLSGVTTEGGVGSGALAGIDVEVRAGEVLGVCGVAGNGQRQLAEVITGLRRPSTGSIALDGVPLPPGDPRAAIEAGVGHVPEDRLHTGLSASASVEDNLVLKSFRSPTMSAGPFLRRSAIRSHARDMVARFGIRTPATTTPTQLLSGGNVQKVVLARELEAEPSVLVAATPTRGLDIGATEKVRAMLREAAASGVAIVLISEDLDEVLALSHRIAVLYEGRIVGVIPRERADVAELGVLMGGGS